MPDAMGLGRRSKKAKKLVKKQAHAIAMKNLEVAEKKRFADSIAHGPKVDHNASLAKTKYQPVHGNKNRTSPPSQYYKKKGSRIKYAKEGKLKKY